MDQETLFEGVGTPVAARQVLRDQERHAIFVREMVKTDNRTQSAIAAGFSKKTASSQGSRLMTDPAILRAIRHERQRLKMENPDLSADRLLRELGCAALVDPRELVDEHGKQRPLQDLDELTARALGAVEVIASEGAVKYKYKLNDKNGAALVIARIMGYGKDKLEISGRLSLEQLIVGADAATD